MKVNKSEKLIPNERICQLQLLLNSLSIEIDLFEKKGQNNVQRNISIFNEALTHTSANSIINHERLEFLGDAVLRLTASEFIENRYPNMQVGERSALRGELVSDRWLSQVGKKIKIKDFLILGPQAAGDISALTTLEAEATEALIGAIYQSSLGIKTVHLWLTPYWTETSRAFLADPYKYNSKSALQEWSQKLRLKLPEYLCIEENQRHGDAKRFFSTVHLDGEKIGEGWGSSRRVAEQEAARQALDKIKE